MTPVTTHTESTLIPAEIERHPWGSSRLLRAPGGWCAERLRTRAAAPVTIAIDPMIEGKRGPTR